MDHVHQQYVVLQSHVPIRLHTNVMTKPVNVIQEIVQLYQLVVKKHQSYALMVHVPVRESIVKDLTFVQLPNQSVAKT